MVSVTSKIHFLLFHGCFGHGCFGIVPLRIAKRRLGGAMRAKMPNFMGAPRKTF
jgi:hypothetical protein